MGLAIMSSLRKHATSRDEAHAQSADPALDHLAGPARLAAGSAMPPPVDRDEVRQLSCLVAGDSGSGHMARVLLGLGWLLLVLALAGCNGSVETGAAPNDVSVIAIKLPAKY